MRAIRNNLPAMFPDREVDEQGRLRHIPKTLMLAKDDSHAEDIARIAREELGKGNDVIAEITYRPRTRHLERGLVVQRIPPPRSLRYKPPTEFENDYYRHLSAQQQPLPGEPALH